MNFTQKLELAENPNTPQETLTLLARGDDFSIHCWVANNPNTPQYVKDYLTVRNFMRDYANNKTVHLIPV